MASDGFGWLRKASDGFGWLRMAWDGLGRFGRYESLMIILIATQSINRHRHHDCDPIY